MVCARIGSHRIAVQGNEFRRTAGFAVLLMACSAGFGLLGTVSHAVDVLPADSLTANGKLNPIRLERFVLAKNPDLEAAWQSLVAARERPAQVGALPDPVLDGTLAPRSFSEDARRVGYGVALTQDLPLSKLGPRSAAARHDARAEAAEYRLVRDELIRTTRHTYIDYVLAISSKQINQDLVELTDGVRRMALARYAAGLVDETDALQAETELTHLEHRQMVYVHDERIARARLNALLRRNWDASLPPPASLELPQALASLDSLIAFAWQTRPEINAADARVSASAARVSLASREYIPDLQLSFRYRTFMDDRRFWPRIGVALNLPIHFGRMAAKKREAEANLAMNRALVVARQDDVAAQVEDAYLRAEENRHHLDQFTHAVVPVSERTLDAVRAGYEAGRNDILALLTAEHRVADARLGQLRALCGYHARRADLDRAIGQFVGNSGLDGLDGEERR